MFHLDSYPVKKSSDGGKHAFCLRIFLVNFVLALWQSQSCPDVLLDLSTFIKYLLTRVEYQCKIHCFGIVLGCYSCPLLSESTDDRD